MEVILGAGTSANAHTYGNVMSYVREVLANFFEPNLFCDIHMSSQAFFRNRSRKNLKIKEAVRKRYDGLYMHIHPSFETPDDDIFLYNTFLTTNFDNIEAGISRKSLQPLIKDALSQYEMRFKLNRDRISFDVTINCRSQIEQIDLYKRMRNTLKWNRPYTQKTSLESLIPRRLISYISKLKNTDIDSMSNIGIMIHYLQQVSSYPITYKMRNSTSQDEFFMYYTTNILLTFSDLQMTDGSRVGMLESDFQITFHITTDFNLPGAFYIMGDDRHPSQMSLTMQIVEKEDNKDEFIPIFTVDKLYDDILNMYEGYKLYASAIIKTEQELVGMDDTFEFDYLFTPNIRQVIANHNTTSVPVHLLFRPKIYRETDLLVEEQDYLVDWNTMRLTIHDSIPESTYRFILYANMGYLNNRLKELTSPSDKAFNELYDNSDWNKTDSPFSSSDDFTFTTKGHQYL